MSVESHGPPLQQSIDCHTMGFFSIASFLFMPQLSRDDDALGPCYPKHLAGDLGPRGGHVLYGKAWEGICHHSSPYLWSIDIVWSSWIPMWPLLMPKSHLGAPFYVLLEDEGATYLSIVYGALSLIMTLEESIRLSTTLFWHCCSISAYFGWLS